MTQYFTPKKDEAKASALNCQISRKFSIELARHIKRKPVNKVLSYLDDVIALKKHVPLMNYNRDVGHKRGQSVDGVKSGRYPVNVAKLFKKVILAAKANADVRGLDKENLLLINAVVSQGVSRFKIQPKGRRRSRQSKATNLEVLVKSIKTSKKSKSEKTAKKTTVEEKKPKAETAVKKETKTVKTAKEIKKE